MRQAKPYFLKQAARNFEKYGKEEGLGFFSKQTGESIHQKFKPIFQRYKIKNTDSEKYGSHLLDAVVAFSSFNI